MAAFETSQLITLQNLNTVYRDIRERIDHLGNIYHVEGSIFWDDLMNLSTKPENGAVYNIIVDDKHKSPRDDIQNGTNVVFRLKGDTTWPSSGTINAEDWENYWEILKGVLEIAADGTAGVIKTYSEHASNSNISSGSIEAGVQLNPEDQAFVKIPVATESTYGVVTNQNQTLSGNKTFQGNIQASNLEVPNNATFVNKLSTSILQVGNITITSNGSKLIFSAT